MLSMEERARIIRDAAAKYNIDPAVALKVARSEGFKEGVWQSNLSGGDYGRREPSYGAFQFLYGGGKSGFPKGLGNNFKDDTGLDPRDPKNEPEMIDYAMDHASKYGWGAWYGAKKLGYTGKNNFAGIGQRPDKKGAGVDTADENYDVPAPPGDEDYPDVPDASADDYPTEEPPSKLKTASGQVMELGKSMMDNAQADQASFDYTPAGENEMDTSAPIESGIPTDAYAQYNYEPEMYAAEGGEVENPEEDAAEGYQEENFDPNAHDVSDEPMDEEEQRAYLNYFRGQ